MLEHPEQALEQAIAGTLSLADRGPLEQHLAICTACKAHLALARVAKLSFRPHPWDGQADYLNVERAIALAARRRSPFARPLGKLALSLSAAALLALGGIASAAWLRSAQARHSPGADALASHDSAHHGLSNESSPLDNASTPSANAFPPALAQLGAQVSPSSTPPGNVLNAQSMSASALFRRASALRASGESAAAIEVFEKLQLRFPSSLESRLSLVIAGRLLLSQGLPAQALAEFDRYLAGRGVASEDALAGRAAALQALGLTDAEASAWQGLLAAYPKSVYDKRARARLSLLRPLPTTPADSSSP